MPCRLESGLRGGERIIAESLFIIFIMKRRRQPSSLTNVKAKLETYFSSGMYYEAQQLYLSLYNRFSARKKHTDAIELLESGVMKLLEHNQTNSAVELALRLIESYEVVSKECDDITIKKLVTMFDNMDTDNREARSTFMKAAIKWSASAEHNSAGNATLNVVLARYLSLSGEDGNAQRYWLRSQCPLEHAQELDKWSEQGLHNERDLFIARAVFQYCCMQNLADANGVFTVFLRRQPSLDTPLIHFTKFLLKTLERDAMPLFQLLREKYRVAIQRDPQFSTMLDKIGHIYYNIGPPKNFLEGMLETFLGGGDGSDSSGGPASLFSALAQS